MEEIIKKVLDPEVIVWILVSISTIQYLTGRITKKQFITEQKKAKGYISKWDAKSDAAKEVVKPISSIINLLNYIPVVNTKMPIVKKSIPDIANVILESSTGLLGDFLHNVPIFGTNIKKK